MKTIEKYCIVAKKSYIRGYQTAKQLYVDAKQVYFDAIKDYIFFELLYNIYQIFKNMPKSSPNVNLVNLGKRMKCLHLFAPRCCSLPHARCLLRPLQPASRMSDQQSDYPGGAYHEQNFTATG